MSYAYEMEISELTCEIYCLVDPRTQEVKYVGSSVDSDARLRTHCGPDASAKVKAWIDELKEAGHEPAKRIYAHVSPDLRFMVETQAIAHFGKTCELLNTTAPRPDRPYIVTVENRNDVPRIPMHKATVPRADAFYQGTFTALSGTTIKNLSALAAFWGVSESSAVCYAVNQRFNALSDEASKRGVTVAEMIWEAARSRKD